MSMKAHLRYLDREIDNNKRQLRSDLGHLQGQIERHARTPLALGVAFGGGFIIGWRRKKEKPAKKADKPKSETASFTPLVIRIAESLVPIVGAYAARFAKNASREEQ